MYRHYYVDEKFLGTTINANIRIFKKVYTDGRIQYILDVKPQSGESQYELKIINEKPSRNNDPGCLVCIAGKAIGKIACRKIVRD